MPTDRFSELVHEHLALFEGLVLKRQILSLLVVSGFFFLAGCGVEKEKLVGVWVVEDGPESLPKGMTWEFTNDGKVKFGSDAAQLAEVGTHEISGNIITLKLNGKDGKGRIKELTDDRLVIKDDAEPKQLVFKKKK